LAQRSTARTRDAAARESASVPARPRPEPAASGAVPVQGGARQVQDLLAARLAEPLSAPPVRWSARRSLAVAAGASMGLWAAIGGVAYLVTHL
jgi:hypothetical protein